MTSGASVLPARVVLLSLGIAYGVAQGFAARSTGVTCSLLGLFGALVVWLMFRPAQQGTDSILSLSFLIWGATAGLAAVVVRDSESMMGCGILMLVTVAPVAALGMMGATVLSLQRGRQRRRTERLIGDGRCPDCEYDLRGTVSTRCPECGSRVPYP